MEISISLSEILVAVLAIISTALGYIIKEQREKIKTINTQLSEKKYKLYHEVYSLLFDLIKNEKSNAKQKSSILESKIIDVKKDLLIYAPDPVLKKFLDWNRLISNNEGDLKNAKELLILYILIRKDMGHPKTKINEVDILKLIMSTDLEVEKMKLLLNLK